jgi:hypothetical protein
MPKLEKISVQIKTGDRDRAGTNGDVYIGICGREFSLDSADPGTNDFERNSDRTYILTGDSATINVRYGIYNNPDRPYELFTENLDLCPVYIRFSPENREDNWNLESVTVIINDGEAQYAALLGTDHLWLGTHAGLYCYLFKSSFT